MTKTHISSTKGTGNDYVWIYDYVDLVFADISAYTKWIKNNSGVDIKGTFIGHSPTPTPAIIKPKTGTYSM